MNLLLKVIIRSIVVAGMAFLLACSVSASPKKWDYESHPLKVADDPAWPAAMSSCANAFDGYGRQGAGYAWQQVGLPKDQSPMTCEIDYGAPVAVSAFVHYFFVPDGRDFRSMSVGPSAFRRVRISSKDEGGEWVEVANLKNLPPSCPQTLPVNATKPARFWRIEVLELDPGASSLISYEIDTYTGGIPQIEIDVPYGTRFKTAFVERVTHHKPTGRAIGSSIGLGNDAQTLKIKLNSSGKATEGGLQLLINGNPMKLTPAGKGSWKTALGGGNITIASRPTAMGMLIEMGYAAEPASPVKYVPASVRITTPKANLFYVPAYVWSTKPVEQVVDSAHVQTRFAALGTQEGTFCLVPGTDRGSIGFTDGALRNDLLLGPNPTPILVSFVAGDWWDAYKFAVGDIYDFKEPTQLVPVSEVQYGVSNYMMSDEVWESKLGTVKSWPERDPHYTICGFIWCFSMYGAPYSMPLYWDRYVMSGDQTALDRLQSIARWLCRSGVRMQTGPARGAFFNLQKFPNGKELKLEEQGLTQASTSVLTSQSTGAALWSLLYYRKMTGVNDPEINTVIREAVDWLLKTQGSDGGWPYGHDIEGKSVDAAPSAGCSWNIWALWRLGKETSDTKCLEAAARGVKWYKDSFVKDHHYHGYWEDVGPASREGYDAAIAAVAFGEMGEKDLAVQTARDAMQWVFTRQIECRDSSNSAGLVAEQTTWPPASYCNPMMGLAAYTAWQITGDDFWKPFAMIPKAVGWWYQPDTGAIVWMPDSQVMAPMVGRRHFESWWCDWCIAQPGSLMVRWLVREVNRRAEGLATIDEETLGGSLLGKNVRAWAPRGGLHPTLPAHGQVNWLGFKSEDSLMVAFMNHDAAGAIDCRFSPTDVYGADVRPKAVHRVSGGQERSKKWDGTKPTSIGRDEFIILEWSIRE